jgi:hypothetical protein
LVGVVARCNSPVEGVVGNCPGSLVVGTQSVVVGTQSVVVGIHLGWLEGSSLVYTRNFEVYLGCCATRRRRWFEAS